jgi:hypothetical protein
MGGIQNPGREEADGITACSDASLVDDRAVMNNNNYYYRLCQNRESGGRKIGDWGLVGGDTVYMTRACFVSDHESCA